MDPYKNPFSPGAGALPPELVGRNDIISQALLGVGRSARFMSSQSMILTGLRGVGKTVLLHTIKNEVEKKDGLTLFVEASEGKTMLGLLIPVVRRALLSLDRIEGVKDGVRESLRVLLSFIQGAKVKVSDVEFGFDIGPKPGTADSGNLEADLPDLLEALGKAAKEKSKSIVLLFDELQYLPKAELSALIVSIHRIQPLQLPLYLVGAGLPTLRGMADDAKSYAERLFIFKTVGPLSKQDTASALEQPVGKLGVSFEKGAVDIIYENTRGYPYFIQEWGQQSWNTAQSPTIITKQDILDSTEQVIEKLDESFFKVRFDRLTEAEKNYLRAMAELKESPSRTGEVAALVGTSSSGRGPVRDSLLKKRMIYSPSHGLVDYTVPLFGDFMKRTVPKIRKVSRNKREKTGLESE